MKKTNIAINNVLALALLATGCAQSSESAAAAEAVTAPRDHVRNDVSNRFKPR
jgi:PBP1b-binding outer membrane lipoprotein LpoB